MVVKVVVDYAIPDIARFVVDGRRMRGCQTPAGCRHRGRRLTDRLLEEERVFVAMKRRRAKMAAGSAGSIGA